MKVLIVAALACAAVFAQEKPAASSKTAATATITDQQRLRFREIERDYAQAQIVITQAQAAQQAAQAAQERQTKLQTEAQDLIKIMQASCKTSETWDAASLKCDPKPAEPKK